MRLYTGHDFYRPAEGRDIAFVRKCRVHIRHRRRQLSDNPLIRESEKRHVGAGLSRLQVRPLAAGPIEDHRGLLGQDFRISQSRRFS